MKRRHLMAGMFLAALIIGLGCDNGSTQKVDNEATGDIPMWTDDDNSVSDLSDGSDSTIVDNTVPDDYVTPVTCGNSMTDIGEACDGDAKECTQINAAYTGGWAECKSDCSGYGTATCTGAADDDTPVTDDGQIVTDDGEVPDADGLPLFSFFVTSLVRMQELSNNSLGFGGDLRYGEADGLTGADKICAEIAEKSMPGASAKQWRAFLCTSSVNAIDRIGEGPWYDRLGRMLALNKTALMNERPTGGDATIADDFPNEDGVPNHQPDPLQAEVDNHDFLTGCNKNGAIYSQTATCADWTSTATNIGKPRVGHSWPRTMLVTNDIQSPPPGDQDMADWRSALDESGCAPGINLLETGGPGNDGTVGSGGGYGGIYCFALVP